MIPDRDGRPDSSGINSSVSGDIRFDRCAVPDPRTGPDSHAKVHGRSHTDLSKIFDRDLTGKQSSGGQVHAFSDLSVMGDHRSRIDQRSETDSAFGTDIAMVLESGVF